jgi:hypothetical protein
LGHLDVGDVEGLARLVEPVPLAVLRQHLLDHEPGGLEEVADRMFVLEAVEPPPGRPAFSLLARAVGLGEGPREGPQEGAELQRIRTSLLGRRHLPVPGAVVDLHPGGEGLRIGRVKGEPGEVEAAFGGLRVMALEAVLLEKGGRASDRLRPRVGAAREGEQEEESSGHGRIDYITSRFPVKSPGGEAIIRSANSD